MSNKRFYPGAAYLLDEVLEHLKQKYGDRYEVQLLKTSEDPPKGHVFQMRKHYASETSSTLHKLTGLDQAATAKFRIAGDSLDVEVGGGKWLDKAAVAGFAAFVAFGLLLIPAGIGAYQQYQLIEEMSAEIDGFMASRGIKAGIAPEEKPAPTQCPGCGADIKPEMKFCPYCGRPLR